MKTTLGSLLTVVLLRSAHHTLARLRVLHLCLLLPVFLWLTAVQPQCFNTMAIASTF